MISKVHPNYQLLIFFMSGPIRIKQWLDRRPPQSGIVEWVGRVVICDKLSLYIKKTIPLEKFAGLTRSYDAQWQNQFACICIRIWLMYKRCYFKKSLSVVLLNWKFQLNQHILYWEEKNLKHRKEQHMGLLSTLHCRIKVYNWLPSQFTRNLNECVHKLLHT